MIEPNPPEFISIWDRAESDCNRKRARVFERDWHRARGVGEPRPGIEDYLPSRKDEIPAALLALARVDMACRFAAGQYAGVESYLSIDGPSAENPDFLAGLAFEEYILRVELGEKPSFAEFARRFPSAENALKELILIQEAVSGEVLIEEAEAEAKRLDGFPKVGQIFEGFELVDELGVGSFAKVYLARDKSLAGRQVALKVTKGNRDEWTTLAKLQHTHIVPIYSHQKTTVDEPRLDLVCMPYFGKVTLNTVIEHEDWGRCLNGQDIVHLIESLQPEPLVEEARESSARRSLANLSFAQAVAWWGACLADALRHAHERRVLHRDIKPTNILITPACEPMLLDFNLAQITPILPIEGDKSGDLNNEPESGVGGTFAYMAPEHLEAMITGQSRLVDHRADIYSLGTVLYQALTRCGVAKKSYVPAGSNEEMLRQNLELRKLAPCSVRDVAPDVPVVLDRVIRKCLDPDPARRYDSASTLCDDLRAIAADLPLAHASEPVASRVGRRLRRNRTVLVSIATVTLILLFGPGYAYFQKIEQSRLARLTRDSMDDLKAASQMRVREDFLGALNTQRRVSDRLRNETSLQFIHDQAIREINTTRAMENAIQQAQAHLSTLGWLRYRMLHCSRFGGELDLQEFNFESEEQLRTLILPLMSSGNELNLSATWLRFLNEDRRKQFIRWADITMFQSVCTLSAQGDQKSLILGIAIAQDMKKIVGSSQPWEILERRLSAKLENRPDSAMNWPDPSSEHSDVSALQFARLALLDGNPDKSIAWFRRAITLSPGDPWVHHELAVVLQQKNQFVMAFDRLEIATSLDAESAWARLDRARLARLQGEFQQARDDLQILSRQFQSEIPGNQILALLSLENGLVEMGMGRSDESKRWLDPLVKSESTDQSLRLVAAEALSELYLTEGRWEELQAILDIFDQARFPDSSWALIRARLMLGQGRIENGIEELTNYLKLNPDVSGARAMRCQAYLKIGQPWEALGDARMIVEHANTAAHRRLLDRCRIAILAELGENDDRWFQILVSLRLDDPESIRLWPVFNHRELIKVVEKLRKIAGDPRLNDSRIGNIRNRCWLNLAVLESALRLEAWRNSLAKSFLNDDYSIYTIRAQVLVLLSQNELDEALNRLEEGLRISFEDPMLVELRGRIHFANMDYDAALRDFDNILTTREIPELRAWRAKTLERLARWNESLTDLTIALAYDPFQPDWRMTRARIWQRLGRIDLAEADLTLVKAESSGNPYTIERLALAKTFLASSHKHSPHQSNKLIQSAARSVLPQFFVRPGIEELEFKIDRNLERTGAVKP